jgi:energy-coupling factor transporter ATP-binding protein EcfA2
VIIVEGPDGGGKSTLVRTLSAQLKLPIADKVVGSDTMPLTDLVAWTENNVSRGFQTTIFDRHRLISEPIYSPFRDQEPTTKFLDLGWVSEMTWNFYAAKPLIIYALPGIETVRQNVYDPSTENQFVADWINHIYAGYVSKASSDLTRVNCRLYNYKVTRLDDIVGWVKWNIDQRTADRDAAAQFPGPRTAPDSSSIPGQRRSRTQGSR